MGEFTTIKNNATAEIVEKKSKFIANAYYVESKDEAEEKLKEIRRKYNDARHNCYAYRVLNEETIFEKCSDDGEPSGTAGAPMINILQRNNLCNVLVVVTRYFGGILLGTGGLVKAYSEATKNALEKAEITKIEEGFLYKIEIKYSDLENFQYFIKNNDASIIKEEYFENVFLHIFMPKNKIECLKSEKINSFNIIKMEKQEKMYTKKP